VEQKVRTQTVIKKDINRRGKVCGRKWKGFRKKEKNKELK